ncbi:unnamed protein product [Bemisia tabaci]|uniref:Uncharacterized protein n=1 Tax=Bemisia tabaci TaxID=7038 RepID=A0A9P0F4L1_BEMTA|nr:unnamed protein product [Bemisia tabaci]
MHFKIVFMVIVINTACAIGSDLNFNITTAAARTFSEFKERIQDGFYKDKGFFGFRDLVGPRLELDFVLPFVKLPIFGVGPLIELDAQSITAAFTAIVFLYIVPKLLFLLYPNYQLPPAPAAGPDRGERSFDMPFDLHSVEEFLRTYVMPVDSCSSANSSYMNMNITSTNPSKKTVKFYPLNKTDYDEQ